MKMVVHFISESGAKPDTPNLSTTHALGSVAAYMIPPSPVDTHREDLSTLVV
jgi:hypothetical protein